jgi:hypothetical protein
MTKRAFWAMMAAAFILVMASAAATVYFDHLPAGPAGKKSTPSGNNNNSSNATCSQELATDGGGHMTMSIPVVGTILVSTDVKDHYTLPSGAKKLWVNISWDKTGWDLDLSIGTGDCPDNGTIKAARNDVKGGPVTLEISGTNGPLENGQWFVHAACNDPNSHRGESVTFSYTVSIRCCG